MSGNSGAWGVVMWQNNKDSTFGPDQEQGIAISGGSPVDAFLAGELVGCLNLPPDGLGVPPVRSGDVAFAQRDGVQQFGDYYEPRQITLQVSTCNDTCPGCPSVRQKVKRLTREWSRACASATLVLFTDCHQPNASDEEKTYLGPYAVVGRPRIAEVTWMRSNRGCAQITLRFDADDARLILIDTDTPFIWNSVHTQFMQAGAGNGANMAQDYRLENITFNTQDAVATQGTISADGPDGGSYHQISITTANTVSPMSAPVGGAGTAGIPVTAGLTYTLSWWARQILDGAIQHRTGVQWYDAGGATVGALVNGTDMDADEDWTRYTDSFVAPVGAAFMRPTLFWTGLADDGQSLDMAQLWINQGAVATGPDTIEVVGDLCAFPVFRLDGPLTAPIQVFYGPFSFTYDEDVSAFTQVTVDTRWGRASAIGTDLTQNLLGTYDFPLPPGQQDFSFTTGDPSDTGSVQIEWQNAVVSA